MADTSRTKLTQQAVDKISYAAQVAKRLDAWNKRSDVKAAKKRANGDPQKMPKPPRWAQIQIFDSEVPRLVLRLSYDGAKTYRALHYIKRVNKKGKLITAPAFHSLGRHGNINLKQARALARTFLADPQKVLEQKRDAELKAQTGSFKEVAENWFKRHVEAEGIRSVRDIRAHLDRYIYPEWENLQFTAIRRTAITNLMDKIEDGTLPKRDTKLVRPGSRRKERGRSRRKAGGRRQADLVLATISSIMTWQQKRTDDYDSPVLRGMRRAKHQGAKRDRVLNDDELRAFRKACGEMGAFGDLSMVLLHTAQRRDKVARMRHDEIKDGVWHIPTQPREKSNAGALPLPKIVLDLIAKQPRVAGNPYVFIGSKRGRRPWPPRSDEKARRASGPPHFNSFSQRKAELDTKLREQLPKMEPWILHDLRRTARSLMSSAGVRPDIAERVLGHAIPGVEGVYDRHHYTKEKGEALKQLAHAIDAITNPPQGNVVVMQPRAGRRRRSS